MPYRKTPIVPGETYHVFNRSIARMPIFITQRDYQRALEVFTFYCIANPPFRFSHYNRLPLQEKSTVFDEMMKKGKRLVEVFAFCFMPNHVHFLMKELQSRGIATLMSNFQNSYAKYFNIKREREGTLFQSMFKAVRIETDEQFLHVARYIHLNPVTAFILRGVDELENYPWSSFSGYVGKQSSSILNTKTILSHFPSRRKFIAFTKDQVDYQRKLDKIKHVLLE